MLTVATNYVRVIMTPGRLTLLAATTVATLFACAACLAQVDPCKGPRSDGPLVWGVDTVLRDGMGSILVGLEVGMTYSELGQSVDAVAGQSMNNAALKNAEDNTGYDYLIGLSLDVQLGNTTTDKARLGIMMHAEYVRESFTSKGTGLGNYDVQVVPARTQTSARVSHSLAGMSEWFQLSAGLRYTFWGLDNWDVFGFGAPFVRTRLSHTEYISTDEIAGRPPGQVFPFTNDSRSITHEQDKDAPFIQTGLSLGIGTRIPISSNFRLSLLVRRQAILFGNSDDRISLASDGYGDRSRELSGMLSDIVYSDRSQTTWLASIGLWISL